MPEMNQQEPKISLSDVIIEALKGIRSEILLYAIVVAALFIGSAGLGIEIFKELKWPLVGIFSVALLAYFIARAVPQAKARLRQKAERR